LIIIKTNKLRQELANRWSKKENDVCLPYERASDMNLLSNNKDIFIIRGNMIDLDIWISIGNNPN
jgi:hypothetical protein